MLFWDLLLATDDPATALQQRYDSTGSMELLADSLGVSKRALQHAFKKYGVKPRKKGGPRPSFRREFIPEGVINLTAAQLAEKTGYSRKYCEKILAKRRKEI